MRCHHADGPDAPWSAAFARPDGHGGPSWCCHSRVQLRGCQRTWTLPPLVCRLLPDFLEAGKESPLRGLVIMRQLPPANLNALTVTPWPRACQRSVVSRSPCCTSLGRQACALGPITALGAACRQILDTAPALAGPRHRHVVCVRMSAPPVQMLLELWQRVACRSEQTGMDAAALAEAVAPCMAWEAPLQHSNAQVTPTHATLPEPIPVCRIIRLARSGGGAQAPGPT